MEALLGFPVCRTPGWDCNIQVHPSYQVSAALLPIQVSKHWAGTMSKVSFQPQVSYQVMSPYQSGVCYK